MSNIKKILAFAVAALIMISCVSCNANATWILKADEEEIPVGVYICCIADARSEAQKKVDEQLAPQEETEATTEASEAETTTAAAETTTEEVKYEKHKIDGTDFDTWVSDRAVELTKEIIVIEQKFKEYGLELEAGASEYIDSYWDYYSDFYTRLGVSEKSFRRYFSGNIMRNQVMAYYYGEDGEEPVDKKTLTAELKENYLTTYSLQLSKSTTVADENGNQTYGTYDEAILKKLRAVMDGYAEDLQNGAKKNYKKIEKDFQDVTNKICNIAPTEDASTTTQSTSEETTEKYKETENVQTYNNAGEDNDETTANLFEAKIGKAGWFETDGAFVVYLRTDDITSNPYYLENNKSSIISDLKEDDYDALLSKWADELKTSVNKAALKAYTYDLYEKAEKEQQEATAAA